MDDLIDKEYIKVVLCEQMAPDFIESVRIVVKEKVWSVLPKRSVKEEVFRRALLEFDSFVKFRLGYAVFNLDTLAFQILYSYCDDNSAPFRFPDKELVPENIMMYGDIDEIVEQFVIKVEDYLHGKR